VLLADGSIELMVLDSDGWRHAAKWFPEADW